MDGWHDFFVAQAGASAALAGLIFVGVSVSLADLIKTPITLLRAVGALVLLGAVLCISTLMLVPDQSLDTSGFEIVMVGMFAWLAASGTGLRAVRDVERQYLGVTWLSLLLRQVATVPLIIAGSTVLTKGEVGFRWLAPTFVLIFIVAMIEAWIILVEIHR